MASLQEEARKAFPCPCLGSIPTLLCCWAFQLRCSQAAPFLSLSRLQGLYTQPRDPQHAGGNGRCPCCLRRGELLCPWPDLG